MNFVPIEAKRFLDHLGKNGKSRLRAFGGGKNDHGFKGDFREAIVRAQIEQQRSIYLVIGNGGDIDDEITSVPALFVEWDDKPVNWQLSAWEELGLPEPTFQVNTGNKSVHTYWVLDEPIAPDKWKELQLRLIAQCGSDPSLKNPSRVMRVPGCPHTATGKLAKIVNEPGHRYSLGALESAIAPLPAPAPPKTKREPTEAHSRDTVLEALHCIPPRVSGEGQTEPSYDDWMAILWAVASELGPDEAAAVVAAHCPGWDEDLVMKARDSNGSYSIGTLFYWAKKFGYRNPKGQTSDSLDPERFRDLAEETQRLSALGDCILLEDYLDPELAWHLRVVSKSTGLPDASVLGLFLTCASCLLPVGSKVIGSRGHSFSQTMTLFSMLVGRSGVAKTPTLNKLIHDPLLLIRKTLAKEYAESQQAWREQCKGMKKDERPEPPPMRVLQPTSATGEALQMLCANNEQLSLGALLCPDEISGLFGGFNAYRQGRGNDQQLFLELYDGKGHQVLRIKGCRSYEHSQVSIIGGIQPDVLGKMLRPSGTAEDSDGFWSRFLYFQISEMPPRLCPDDDGSAYERSTQFLQGWLHELFANREPREFELNYEARTLFLDWEYDAKLRAHGARNAAHAAVFGKTPGKVLRIAGLLHFLNDSDGHITPEPLLRAMSFVEWADEWAIKLYEEAGDKTLRTTEWLARRLVSKAEKTKGGLTPKQFRDGLNKREKTGIKVEHIRAAMQYACELELGRIVGESFRVV